MADLCEGGNEPAGFIKSFVNSYGHHALSFVMSKGRLSRHSSLNDIIKRALTSSGVPSILEPSGISRSDGKRPDDLTLVQWRVGKSLIWDSTCVDTLAPSHLSSTSKTPGCVAESAAVIRHHKYKHIADNYIFVPFAAETFGSWRSEAKALISTIGRSLVQLSGDPRSSQYLRQRIGTAIQRGNATSILASFPEGTWFRERYCDDTPLAGQRQIQIERSLTPVSERVEVVGRKREKSTASHNVLVSRIFAAAALNP
ncbi:hypothetical protein ANN_12393 [Periplaneta americana]|uniref:MACPF domain-containing protein n=1 Tax=Periplaneta americana TaxID=6978 RepID=A0ABQ8TGD7_PERAM|nr:hypothetical protein ANN_12393 [Periplaneta americana]